MGTGKGEEGGPATETKKRKEKREEGGGRLPQIKPL